MHTNLTTTDMRYQNFFLMTAFAPHRGTNGCCKENGIFKMFSAMFLGYLSSCWLQTIYLTICCLHFYFY